MLYGTFLLNIGNKAAAILQMSIYNKKKLISDGDMGPLIMTSFGAPNECRSKDPMVRTRLAAKLCSAFQHVLIKVYGNAQD